MLVKSELESHYIEQALSLKETASALGCSVQKVIYWMKKYNIKIRTRSEANYLLYNRGRVPFTYRQPDTPYLLELYGMGIGLFWGEGNKACRNSVRLGNSDVLLLKKFIEFLEKIYNIDRNKLRFGIQLFNDIDASTALRYWSDKLGYDQSHFMKPVRTNQKLKGTYRKKSLYGVVTIYFHNTKLRNILIDSVPKDGVKYSLDKPT